MNTLNKRTAMDDSDERETLLNGRVANHGLAFIMALLLLTAALSGLGVHIATESWTCLLIIVLTSAFINAETCFIGAVDFDKQTYLGTVTAFGAMGAFLAVVSIVTIAVFDDFQFVADRQLTTEGAGFIAALCCMTFPVAYFAARAHYRKNADD